MRPAMLPAPRNAMLRPLSYAPEVEAVHAHVEGEIVADALARGVARTKRHRDAVGRHIESMSRGESGAPLTIGRS